MKKLLVLLMFIICLCTCCMPVYADNGQDGTGFQKNPVTGFSHPFIDEYEMPIVGLVTPPSTVNSANPSFITRKNFEIYKDAGFNILLPCYERPTFKEAEVRRGLEYCSDLGIVYLVNDASIMCAGSAGANGTIDGYKNLLTNAWYAEYASFGGVAAKDEPNVNDFDEMAKGSAATKAVYPNYLFFSTLFPQGANRAQLGVATTGEPSSWEEYYYYVDSFIEKVNPNLLVYDSYIWHYEGAGRTLSVEATKNHFKTLSCYRNRSLQQGIPFWSTIMTHRRTTHPVDSDYTTKELNWVVNTTLAYGAKGLSYYTYWPTIEGYNDAWLTTPIRDGMVTATGTPHDAYYKIQEINNNVKLIDEYIMPAKHLGIMQFGEFKNDLEDVDKLETCGYLKNVSGGDSFIGCFELNGKKLYYVVNNSLTAGITTFQCDFTRKVSVTSRSLKYGENSASGVYSYAFNLSAGEAILLEVA